MMLPPPCLTRRMVFMPGTHTKKLNLCLIRPDNFLSRGPRVLQVPFGRLQMCCRPCALWPLYHKDLSGGWLQRGLSFWKVLTRMTTGFSVNSLTTQLSSPKPRVNIQPALGKVLVVLNFFHLLMMDAIVLSGTFKAADIFLYPFLHLSLNTIPSQTMLSSFDFMLGLCSNVHCGTLCRRGCVPFQVMSNQLN